MNDIANLYRSPDLGDDYLPGGSIQVIYGTQTGNSEELARETAKRITEIGLPVQVSDMEEFNTDDLKKIKILLVIVSTDGDGELPLMAEDLFEFLQHEVPPLNHLIFSVLGLGDTTYTEFCRAGKEFDVLLSKLGACRMFDRVDCDVDFEVDYDEWTSRLLPIIELNSQLVP